MKVKKILLCCLAFLLLFTANTTAETKIVLASLDWEPYIGSTMKENGYVAEVVREALKRKGYDLEIKFMTWARVIKMAKAGKYDGYFPEYYAEELKKDFKVSSPLPGGPLGFYKRKGTDINFTKMEDLKPYTIGVVRGYVNTKEFDDATYLKKEEVKDDILNFRKLFKNRIDLVVADKFVGKYLVEKNIPDKLAELEFVEPPLENKDLFVCISKKTPGSMLKFKALEDGLKEITDDGTVQTILKKHGF